MNPILITIGKFEIRWYSILILLGCFLVFSMSRKEGERFDVPKAYMFNLLFWALVFGILGARLYYVIFNIDMYKDNILDIFKIWNGGLAIHGGLIAGLLTVIAYTKKYNVRTIRIVDFIVVPLVLAQAIGRWGNFFNSEAHGAATTVAHLKSLFVPDFIINGMTIDGVVYMPTFLFESILCVLLFIVLFVIRRGKYTKVGTLTAVYLLGYGSIRFFIEMSRTDALLLGGFKVAQIVSVIMVIVGLGILMFLSRKNRFEDLYNDKENIDKVRY